MQNTQYFPFENLENFEVKVWYQKLILFKLGFFTLQHLNNLITVFIRVVTKPLPGDFPQCLAPTCIYHAAILTY